MKYRNQLLAGFFRHRISPGTKRYQEFTLCIKRHIAVHHSAESQCPQRSQLLTVFCLHIVCQALITALQSFPDVLQAICPNIVLQSVLPVVSSHGNGGVANIYQYRFDPGGTEFNTKNRLSCFDGFFCCFVHLIFSLCFYIVSASFFLHYLLHSAIFLPRFFRILLTLVSINFSIIRQCFKVHTSFVFCRYIFMVVWCTTPFSKSLICRMSAFPAHRVSLS